MPTLLGTDQLVDPSGTEYSWSPPMGIGEVSKMLLYLQSEHTHMKDGMAVTFDHKMLSGPGACL